MNDADSINLALLVFRTGVGAVILAHGVNHIWGGGKIDGTARWFESMGMRPPMVQAWLASLTEIAAGVSLVFGFLTPLGGAGVVGVMVVAWAINHRGNGFFIFRPGEGWEYVLTLGLCGMLLGVVGPGQWSIDDVLGLVDDLTRWNGLLLSAGVGTLGAGLVLASCWRPPPVES